MRYLLGITHTDRAFDLTRCSLNFLQRRYADPRRLCDLPPFETLPDAASQQPYDGSATFWVFDADAPDRLHLARRLDPGYKVQHAVYADGRFVLAGHDFIEFRDTAGDLVSRVTDPWMSGLHTCFAHDGRVIVSASGSDAVLVVDPVTEQVADAFRMPESVYGRNYALRREDDTRAHFIDNDRQLTHLNCAWPTPEGIYVSTLIHGAIGRFAWDGSYEELVRGYWGCHGVRTIGDDTILFSDSCLGCACLLDRVSHRLVRRIDFGSQWLHDTATPDGRFFFAGLGDTNCVVAFDAADSRLIGQWPMDRYGAGVQFISVCPLPADEASWIDTTASVELRASPISSTGHAGATTSPGRTLWSLAPPALVPQGPAAAIMRGSLLDVTTGPEPFGYAVATPVRGCDPDLFEHYTLTLDATLHDGGFSVGVLDAQHDTFVFSGFVEQAGRHRHELSWPRRAMPRWFRIVVSNHEPAARASSFRLHEVALSGRGEVDETAGPEAFFAPETPHRYRALWTVDLTALDIEQAEVTPEADGSLHVVTPPSTGHYALMSAPRHLDLSAVDEICLRVDATVEQGGFSALVMDSTSVRELPVDREVFTLSGAITETQRREHEIAGRLGDRPRELTVVISNFSPAGSASSFHLHGISVAGRRRPY